MKSSENLSGVKNILITGRPGCGKTTLIMEILKELNLKASGFYTSEIRIHGKRKGFSIVTLSGKRGILAHQNIHSEKRVSKYGVNLKDLEELGVSSISRGLKEGGMNGYVEHRTSQAAGAYPAVIASIPAGSIHTRRPQGISSRHFSDTLTRLAMNHIGTGQSEWATGKRRYNSKTAPSAVASESMTTRSYSTQDK